jgi:hypothetical protein
MCVHTRGQKYWRAAYFLLIPGEGANFQLENRRSAGGNRPLISSFAHFLPAKDQPPQSGFNATCCGKDSKKIPLKRNAAYDLGVRYLISIYLCEVRNMTGFGLYFT